MQPASSSSAAVPTLVNVHPLVLLSAVDHFSRMSIAPPQRVVGVLLGTQNPDRSVDVTNSYGVPFEEGSGSAFYLDQNYHENMWALFKKVSTRERVVGWYSTGPKICMADLQIHQLFRAYTPHPVFVIIDVQQREIGLPTKAYVSAEEVAENGKTQVQFQHIASTIEALEAEEIGVEHLLRDVKDTNVSALATRINGKVAALRILVSRIEQVQTYLAAVLEGTLELNLAIIQQIQDVFNLMPNIAQGGLGKAFNVQTNDSIVAIYLSSIIRAVISLHDLIDNKIAFKRGEEIAIDDAAVAQPATPAT